MKFLLVLIAFAAMTVQAQDNNVLSNGIYKSAADFNAHVLSYSFNKPNHRNKIIDKVTHHVYVRKNDSSVKYKYMDIWGFRKNNRDWRIFDDTLFQVVYTGKVYVYIIPTKTDYSVDDDGYTRFQTTWFSVTASSPVFELTRFNLLNVYGNNSSLLKKLSGMSENATVDKKDKATGDYKFVSWLN